MINQFSLGGFTYSSTGQRIQLSVIHNPNEQTVLEQLKLVCSTNGFLSLWMGEEDEPGEYSLNLEYEVGKCYLEFSEVNSDGERIIYRLFNPDRQATEVTILGQSYNDQCLVDDFQYVELLFVQFLKTGGKVPSNFSVTN